MTARSAVSFAVLSLALASVGCRAAAQAHPAAPRFEVLPLQFVNAAEVAPRLGRVFAGSTLRVEADARTNSLLLAGAPNELADAKARIAHLDVKITADDGSPAYTVIPLQYVQASEMYEALRGLSDSAKSRIAMDLRTNSLVVEATPAALERIQQVVAHFDQER